MDRTRLAALAAALWLGACEAEAPAPAPEAPAESGRPAPAPAPGAKPEPETSPAPVPAPGPAAGAPAGPWSPRGYRLVGTEPFWGGIVSAGRILYQTPENEAGEAVAVAAALGPAREIYSGTLAGKAFELTLTKGPCSDGMSDNVHAFTATLSVAGETRHGCANPQ